MTKCADCGRDRCRGGAFHDILAAERRNERDGYVRAQPYARTLKAAGVELRSCPTSLQFGGPRRRQKVTWSDYAPVYARRAAYLLADVSVRERVALLRDALAEGSALTERAVSSAAGGAAEELRRRGYIADPILRAAARLKFRRYLAPEPAHGRSIEVVGGVA